MLSLKRVLRIGVPVAALVVGVTLYAQSGSTDCAHPSLLVKVMQASHLAHIQTCAVQATDTGNFCLDVGHHCNVGAGPGKCTNVADPATNVVMCQCVAR